MNEAQLQIFRALSGHSSARVLLEDDRCIHLHSAVSPEREVDYLPPLTLWGDVIVLLGVGLGYQYASAWSELAQAKLVIVVDYFEPCLDLSSKCLGDEVSYQRVGRSDTDRVLELAAVLSGQSVQVVKHPASYRVDPEFYDGVLSELMGGNQRRAGSREAITSVMVLRGGFFFQDELCKAVEALGLSSCPIYYEEYGPEELSQIIEERVAKQKPDLMISVGFKGIDPEGQVLQIARRLGVPVAVWFVDDPRPNCLAFRDNIDANIHAFCWEKHYLEWLEEKGFASVSFLPLAACSSVFDRGIQASSVEPEGLSFTGSAMGESYLAGIRRNFMWDESLTAEVQRRARDLLSGGLNVHTVSKEPLPFTDEKNLSWYSSLVIHTASGMLRRSTCSHLLGRDLVLVGDREGWHAALGSQVTALPDVDYATQLPDIYRQYAINLNITSCQMPSAVNQRLFDAPLGGGFVVTDMKQDAADLFVVDKEVIVYRDLLELDDLVSFYLSRPEQRVKVIEAARLRILAEHKVEHRLATILQRIEKG